METLLTASATRLAARIKAREVSSREVVAAHVAHVRAVNPALNAVVQERFDDALLEADLADRRVATEPASSLPPLLGVPCTIKECFALTGMQLTAGLVARKGRVSREDAVAVRRVRSAGAIPLGVTNTSELCMWMESSNHVYGRTNNPYDLKRIVGGSSGGEGAIIGAGGSPFGLGSDIGGSIRMPAFFNGVFGHKPTGGLVPGTGQYPLPADAARRYVTTGPLTRKAEDLMPVLRIIAGPDGEDPGCIDVDLGDPASIDLGDLDVISVEDNGLFRVHPELKAAQLRAADALSRRGARVRHARLAGFEQSLEMWSSLVAAAGGPSFAELLGEGVAIRPGRELVRWALRRSPHTLPAIVLALIEKLPELLPDRAAQAIAATATLRGELLHMLGDRGVLLFPSYPEPAPRHLMPMLVPVRWAYTAILNVLEVPATQVPLGLSTKGLPLGVQVASSHGADARCIAVAMALEADLGGWVPPPRLFAAGG